LPRKIAAKAYTFYSPNGGRYVARHVGYVMTVNRAPFAYRADPTVPHFRDDQPVIVFDGKCVLCSGFAQFVLRTDHHARFRLLAAQSALGDALYRHFGLDPVRYETYILLDRGVAYFRSEAAIRILEGLGWPWRAASLSRVFPLPLRNTLYDFIARNRLRWFGARQTCYVPDPSQADRFLS
jgi:predicted DCC family thiol-disulfide oxidoreductase YuxK